MKEGRSEEQGQGGHIRLPGQEGQERRVVVRWMMGREEEL